MSNLKIEKMILGSVETNCYFIYKEGQTQVMCIDPADNGEKIFSHLKNKGLQVGRILLTHGHFDHILGANQLRSLSSAKIYAYIEEKDVLEDPIINISDQIGISYVVIADEFLKEGDKITVGDLTCTLIATPGHTKGSCCYYFEDEQALISGDTLFLESVGRTDLPTGSGGTLGRSLKNKLMKLPNEVKVYPGHGDTTTIGHERAYNPFC